MAWHLWFKMQTTVLPSSLDASVNWVTEGDFPGKIEARYVRRCRNYFICYLSSQTGCDKACRMCHLTQTGQTRMVDVDLDDYFRQAADVLAHYDTQEPAEIVHFNFMARGEVFANPNVREHGDELIDGLAEMAVARNLVPRFKFSTIMPEELCEIELAKLFPRHNPDIYYSLYSVNPAFRRRWLPKALPAELALAKLARYQDVTRKIPVIHFAFIEGENDSAEDVEAICEAINAAGLRVDINVVAYNPFSPQQGREPAANVIERNARIFGALLPGAEVKLVNRVGFDVKASCGMFVGGRVRAARTEA